MAAVSSTRLFSAALAVDSERELILRCQRYEAEALAEFFERFHDGVYHFLAARTGDPGLAQELTAETFTRALALLPRHRNRGAGLAPWLLRVANGRLTERRRPLGAVPTGLSPAGLPEGPDPEAVAARLRAALDRLSPEQQEVLSLRFLAPLPLNVVAKAMHRGPAAIQAVQARGLKNLARILAPVAEPGTGT